ncbi:pilus assembly protein TadD [Asticcacaulis sp. EMRT-3]|uniref:pilus assembly protein TadD n=1 Tax=Asticcacaulis sp. EMRT-3 TaxID=3040349 RepID=UPI0024AF04E8|nr:pilus assembly protein TadD [Asticcacaulis sp. EMRT-3]MDI7775440.1 pilus assembly protein TadD [Asticcacaulis sp. EMRT-3]
MNRLATSFCLSLVAASFVAAQPASAGLFGGDKKSDAAVTSTPSAMTTVAGASSEDFHKASKAEIEQTLRADPLAQAAFFSNQFDHDPTNVQIGLYFSNALRALKRYDQAADIAHRVLLFAPDNVDLLLAAARAHIAGNDAFLAIDPLQHAIALKPKDWQAYSLLGVAYQQVKRTDDAQTQWATALQLSPNNPAVLTNIAMAKVVNGDFKGAEPLLRTAAAQKDATIQVRQNLALVLGLEGQMDQAERLLREDLPPQQADADLAWLHQAVAARGLASAAPPAAAPAPAATTDAPGRSWASVQAAGG